ncbi:Ig-like domain-containing protein, partial [Onishia niordana]|uniref:Ig-like domain-containing protein n=1 Tax=Onishia niordana TaxID=2508711 RepID=UPI0010A00E5E
YGDDDNDDGSITNASVTITDAGDGDNSGDDVINENETATITGTIGEGGDSLDSLVISDGDDSTDDLVLNVDDITVDATTGNYEVTDVDVSGLADGELTVTANSTDNDGNSVTRTDTVAKDFTYGDDDNDDGSITNASVTITDAGDGDNSGDDVINENETATITGTIGEGGDSLDSLVITDGQGGELTLDPATVTVGTNGDYTVTGVDVSGLADGELTVTANSTDNDGNSVERTDTVTLDTSAEAGTVIVNNITSDDVINAQEAGETITVTGTATGGDIAEGDSVTMTINGQDYATTVGENGDWSVDVEGSDLVLDTAFDVVVSSTDEAGNDVDSTGSSEHSVDLAADITVSLDDVNSANVATTPINGTTNGVEAGQVVTLVIRDEHTTTADVTVSAVVEADGSYTATADLSSLTDGGLSVTATVEDQAGNQATNDDTATRDTNAVAGTVNVATITDDDVINASEAGQTILVTGTATGGDISAGDSVAMTINGTDYATTVDGNGEWSVGVEGSDLAADTVFDVVVSSTDEAGNSVDSTGSSTHGVDLEAGITVSLADVNTATAGSAPIGGDTTDVEAGQTVNLAITDGTTTVTTTAMVQADGSYATTADLSSLADGDLSVTATVEDQAGNQASAGDTAIFDDLQVGNNANNSIESGSGDDNLFGDTGGAKTIVQPGTNYNVSLIVDTSGSMANASGSGMSRMALAQNALKNLATQLVDHDGQINLQLVDFDSGATSTVFLDITNNDDALSGIEAAIDELAAGGGTNYEAGFNQATDWLDSVAEGYQNLTYFLTDGDPTYYLDDDGNRQGPGNSTSYEVMQNSVNAFAPLSDISVVKGIGIGGGINDEYLKFFDNTAENGTDSVTFGNYSTETIDGLDQYITLTDERADGTPTTVTSPEFTVSVGGSELSFWYLTDRFGGQDSATVLLEKKSESGTWQSVESQDLVESSRNWSKVELDALETGVYRLGFGVENGSGQQDQLTIGSVELSVPEIVTGPVGEVEIVNTDVDLDAALQGSSESEELADAGDDVLRGGEGDDIILGDAPNTDQLALDKGLDLPAGSGWEVFRKLESDDSSWSRADTLEYIEGHLDELGQRAPGGREGGDDTLVGGAGNDILYGQEGADVFAWELGDEGSVGDPAQDIVGDFSLAEGDSLDLAELLVDEQAGSIDDYLHAELSENGEDTILHVSTDGGFAGDYAANAGQEDQTITLEGVAMNDGQSSRDFLDQLMTNGNLTIDQ